MPADFGVIGSGVCHPGSSPLADIFIQCPRTGTQIPTGLKSEWVVLNSLPRVAIPLCCPACGQMHKWNPQDAWIGPRLQGRAPLRVNGSPAACFSASAAEDDEA
jgi:hypothetical protein